MKSARPFSAMLAIWMDVLHIPIDVYIVLSFVLGIALLSVAVIVLYGIFTNKWENLSKLKKAFLMLISYLFIFSYLNIESIFFLETCIVCLGILLSVMACKEMIAKKESKLWFLKVFLLLLLAVFCYQGTIAIFPIVLFTYYAIVEPLKFKDYFKLAIIVTLIYGIVMACNITYACVFISDGSRLQIHSEDLQQTFSFDNIFKQLKYLVVDSLDVILPFVHLGIICVTAIFLLLEKKDIKEKLYNIFLYLIILLASIVISMAPVIVSKDLDLYPRMGLAYGATIAVSLLFMFASIKNKDQNRGFKNIFIYSIISITFILNTILYVVLTWQHFLVNTSDRDIAWKVKEAVDSYEKNTGIEIKYSYNVYGDDVQYYIDDGFIRVLSYNQRAASNWASMCLIWSYTHKMEHRGNISLDYFLQCFDNVNVEEFLNDHVWIVDDMLFFYVK